MSAPAVGPSGSPDPAGGPQSAHAAVLDPDRLAAVLATGLLDTDAEEAFDRLTRLAVRLVGVPAAFVSLVDADRDFYKSACGFGEPLATARELAGPTFCHFTVARATPLVIPDTAADPVYREVPTVRTLGVAAYVGVPLLVGGQAVGAFCAIDTRPHAWTPEEVEVLVELAASAQRELELRARTRALEAANDDLQASAVEREAQAEELQTIAADLEERAQELETARKVAETARAEAEATRSAAEEANAAKSQFLANMSHELRTPLNAIGGYTQLLEMGVRGRVTTEQREDLLRIQRAQRHLLGLINDVLNYAKLEAGHVAYEMGVVDVREVIATVTPLVEPQLAAKGLALDIRLPDGPCEVWADREKLGQVLLNLLSNAIKFTAPHAPVTVPADVADAAGRVTVDLTTRRGAGGDVVFLRVADTGRGIPRDKQAAVFEPFVQVQTGYARGGEGTGLGLAISRDLARGMGGDLRVRSAEGEGATFTVALRRVAAADGTVVDRRSHEERRSALERRDGTDRRQAAV